MSVFSIRTNDEEEQIILDRLGVKKKDIGIASKKFLLEGGNASGDDLNRITIEAQIEQLREEQKKIVEVVVACEKRQRAGEDFFFNVFEKAIGEYVSAEAAASFKKAVIDSMRPKVKAPPQTATKGETRNDDGARNQRGDGQRIL